MALFIALDATQPGTSASYQLITAALSVDPLKVQTDIASFRELYSGYLENLRQSGQVSSERIAAAQDDLKALGVGDALGKAVNAIPLVGQILSGIWQVARQFVAADAEAKAQGHSVWASNWVQGGPAVFTGFRDGHYFCDDIPILAFTAPIWTAQFSKVAGDPWAAVLRALVALCSRYPFGVTGLDRVSISMEGEYTYSFQTDAGTRTLDVYDPADVTPAGPRGYSVTLPNSWRIAGLKKSWAQLGIAPPTWATPYWSAYLVARLDKDAAQQLFKNAPNDVPTLNGVLDGLSNTPPRDPDGYFPSAGLIPPGVKIPATR